MIDIIREPRSRAEERALQRELAEAEAATAAVESAEAAAVPGVYAEEHDAEPASEVESLLSNPSVQAFINAPLTAEHEAMAAHLSHAAEVDAFTEWQSVNRAGGDYLAWGYSAWLNAAHPRLVIRPDTPADGTPPPMGWSPSVPECTAECREEAEVMAHAENKLRKQLKGALGQRIARLAVNRDKADIPYKDRGWFFRTLKEIKGKTCSYDRAWDLAAFALADHYFGELP